MMSDNTDIEAEFGMSKEHMDMLMQQHIDRCPEPWCHQVVMDGATGDLTWGPCPDPGCDQSDHGHD